MLPYIAMHIDLPNLYMKHKHLYVHRYQNIAKFWIPTSQDVLLLSDIYMLHTKL